VNKTKVDKIHHVAILVKDLEEAGKLYSGLFGIEFSDPRESKELDIRSLMSAEGIELVSPLSPDGAMSRTLDRRGEGVQLVALKVANVEEASAEMKSKGIRQVGGTGKIALFHPGDLNGVLIELAED